MEQGMQWCEAIALYTRKDATGPHKLHTRLNFAYTTGAAMA